MVTLRHIAPLALLVACGGRPTGAAPPRMAQTVVTSCPDEAPTLSDDVEQTRLVLGRVIERICVIGSSSTERYAGILRSRGVREGQPLTPDGVGRALETILASPVVDDASIAAEPRGEGVVVYIHVTERPRLDEIVFEGSKVFGDDKLNGRAPFEKGEPIDRHVVHAFIQGIKDEYVTIGYAGVTVEPILEPMAPPAKGHARLRLVIHEGPLYKIAKLSFPGASKLTEEELKKAISVVEGNILDEGRLERAPMLLEAAYLDRGMIKASAGRPKQEASATGAVSVTFPISEGEVYKISSVHVTKAGAKLERELLAQIQSRPGMIYSRSRLILDEDRLRQHLKQRGQAFDVTAKMTEDPKTTALAITFEVEAR